MIGTKGLESIRIIFYSQCAVKVVAAPARLSILTPIVVDVIQSEHVNIDHFTALPATLRLSVFAVASQGG
jgi:hypothetical protein